MGLVHNLAPLIKDFSDTAAILKQLDCVVSVDTSMAHLCGALGIPVKVIIPFHALDWRWLIERTDSPWYPSVTLYRQGENESWAEVLRRVKKDL